VQQKSLQTAFLGNKSVANSVLSLNKDPGKKFQNRGIILSENNNSKLGGSKDAPKTS